MLSMTDEVMGKDGKIKLWCWGNWVSSQAILWVSDMSLIEEEVCSVCFSASINRPISEPALIKFKFQGYAHVLLHYVFLFSKKKLYKAIKTVWCRYTTLFYLLSYQIFRHDVMLNSVLFFLFFFTFLFFFLAEIKFCICQQWVTIGHPLCIYFWAAAGPSFLGSSFHLCVCVFSQLF